MMNAPQADAVIGRLLGDDLASRFELFIEEGGVDEFTVDAVDGRARVVGSTIPTLLAGVRWFVSHELNGHISRHGIHVPSDAPLPDAALHRVTDLSYRFAHNPTVSGYSAAYWGWPEWERELDFLVWSGTTHVLILTGQEAVYRDLLVELGQSDAQARAWLSMPGHMSWQWMGNIAGFGGGQPADLMDHRTELGRRIVDRVRSLGMTPVFPGFAGFVPQPIIDGRDDLSAVPQGTWLGFERTAWIDPTCEGYGEIAARWYHLQSERFGASTTYSMDVLHEGGTAGDIDVVQAGHAIQQALFGAHPDAIWAVQAWGNNPTAELLDGVDRSHLLVLDINADDTPRWKASGEFDGTPWLFGTISTWGGRQYTFGKLPEICRLPGLHDARWLCGTIQAAESLESNPVVDDLLADAIWYDDEIDLDEWIVGYSRRRYGAASERAERAWKLFVRTAYGQYIADDDGSNAGPDSLLVARPGLEIEQAIEWRPRIVPYDTAEFEDGWRELVAAADQLPASDAYLHDVVDFTVQVLSNRSRALLPQVRAAVEDADPVAFAELSGQFMHLLDECDAVLATRSEFLLGTLVEQARAEAGDAGVDDVLLLLTTWGDERATEELHDYAARHTAGLVGGFYRKRWEHFFANVQTEDFDPDWYVLERGWARELANSSPHPVGDTLAVARRLAGWLTPTSAGTGVVDVELEIHAESRSTTATAVVRNVGESVVVLDRARAFHPVAEPILDIGVSLAPGETHRLQWTLEGVEHPPRSIEVAVYVDPSSITTHVVRAVAGVARA